MGEDDHDDGPTRPEPGEPTEGAPAPRDTGPPDLDTRSGAFPPHDGPSVDPDEAVAWKPPPPDDGRSDDATGVPAGNRTGGDQIADARADDERDEAAAGAVIVATVVAPVVGAIAAMIIASNVTGVPADENNARATFWAAVIGSAVAVAAGTAHMWRKVGRTTAIGTGLFLLGACGGLGTGYAALAGAVAPWQTYTPPPATAADPSPTPTTAAPEPDREQEAADADVEPGSAVAQQLFVGYVRDRVHEVSGEPDGAVLEIGREICALLDGGMSTQEVFDELLALDQSTFSADDFGRTIAAADRWLC